mmetsp:Transcript_12560/g.37730  ORF Transcript_12560/g.37730 Transcript_12560/m.37730 type:complete len:215 (-) Transcript_12560:100-744(-)
MAVPRPYRHCLRRAERSGRLGARKTAGSLGRRCCRHHQCPRRPPLSAPRRPGQSAGMPWMCEEMPTGFQRGWYRVSPPRRAQASPAATPRPPPSPTAAPALPRPARPLLHPGLAASWRGLSSRQTGWKASLPSHRYLTDWVGAPLHHAAADATVAALSPQHCCRRYLCCHRRSSCPRSGPSPQDNLPLMKRNADTGPFAPDKVCARVFTTSIGA